MLIIISKYIVIFFSIFIMGVALFMLASPRSALGYIGKGASTNFINYFELTVRGIWGIAFYIYADFSKYPVFFYIFGVFLIGTTMILFIIPREWHARLATIFAHKLTALHLRITAPLALLFGIFLIYAVL